MSSIESKEEKKLSEEAEKKEKEAEKKEEEAEEEDEEEDLNVALDENDVDYSILSRVDAVHSLCMRCGEEGVTRMMMHAVPYFRELFIASFRCEHCGESNNEVTFGGRIQDQGSQYELRVTRKEDLDRQVIKSESASLILPSLELEIPAGTQRGEISTLEGFLSTAAKNLDLHQAQREQADAQTGAKVAAVIRALQAMARGEQEVLPFSVLLRDPAGNSFVQNPLAPLRDEALTQTFFRRTPAEDAMLGLSSAQRDFGADAEAGIDTLMLGPGFGASKEREGEKEGEERAREARAEKECGDLYSSHVQEGADGEVVMGRSEVVRLRCSCPSCARPAESLTAMTDIPHFKEVLLMAFSCEHCGYKNSEVRGGGAVPRKGSQIQLSVTSLDDLKRFTNIFFK